MITPMMTPVGSLVSIADTPFVSTVEGGGGGARTAMVVGAMVVGATLKTASTVTPRAALSVAVGVAASDVAAALAAAELGYVMVAWTPTEAA